MSQEERRAIESILDNTTSFYQNSLNDRVKRYLSEERGFTEQTILRFRIGYAAGGLRDHLINHLGHDVEMCIRAGVLKRNDDGVIQDYFFRRIVFPILKRDQVVHLTGREFDGGGPKYLHLPGEMSFLYNEDALSSNVIFIAEGPTDCITAVQFGLPAIALLGATSFKQEFVPRIAHCEKIFVCLDGDAAGEAGALRIGEFIPDRSYIVRLPQGLDLDEYLREHGPEGFQQIVASSKRFLRYRLEEIPQDIDRAELPRRLETILRVLSRLDEALTEHFLNHDLRDWFSLRSEEVDVYRRQVRGKRRTERRNRENRDAQEKQETNYLAKFTGLVDLAEQNGATIFLVKDGNGITVEDHVNLDGIRFIPPPKVRVPWLLPRSDRVMRNYETCLSDPVVFGRNLYIDIVRYFRDISDLPSDIYYDLLATWAIHTYLLDDVQYSPIICLFSVPERGKSRTGKGLIYLAYRGIHIESLREAYIVRAAENFGCSIFFDVRNVWKKAECSGSEDILLHRFEKGAAVPRVIYPDRGPHKDIVYYSIFGPTIIATNEGIDKILETRAVYINMPIGHRRFENDVVPETALELKERLVALRAWHMGRTLPEAQKPSAARLGDILKPLLQVIRLVNPEGEQGFLALVRRLEQDRLVEKSVSLEAEILNIITNLEGSVWHGYLPVKTIVDRLNHDLPENSRLSYQRVGRILAAMGFRKGRTSDGATAIHYDRNHIVQLVEAYGLRETPETSETPVGQQGTPLENPDARSDTDDTDD